MPKYISDSQHTGRNPHRYKHEVDPFKGHPTYELRDVLSPTLIRTTYYF